MPKIIPVIMSGGAGSRLWPASKRAMPKQLLPLVGEDTMVQQTAQRLSNADSAGVDFSDPVFICNTDHAAPITAQMAAKARTIGAIITEPMGRNTAPVAVAAALYAQSQSPDALVLLAPADHFVTKPDAFHGAVAQALPAATSGKLVTFGITPSHAETGYGYIEKGSALYGDVHTVAAFREKPDAQTAQAYIDSGNFLWNAGIFLFSPRAFLSEIKKHSPDILAGAQRAFDAAAHDGVRIDLPHDEFAACPSESIDYAVMEKTGEAAVVPCDIGWNDIGSFAALHDVLKDDTGMAVPQTTLSVNAKHCLVHSDGPRVALVGVEGVGVIIKDGVVMVVALNAAQDVKKVVDHIKAQGLNALL